MNFDDRPYRYNFNKNSELTQESALENALENAIRASVGQKVTTKRERALTRAREVQRVNRKLNRRIEELEAENKRLRALLNQLPTLRDWISEDYSIEDYESFVDDGTLPDENS